MADVICAELGLEAVFCGPLCGNYNSVRYPSQMQNWQVINSPAMIPALLTRTLSFPVGSVRRNVSAQVCTEWRSAKSNSINSTSAPGVFVFNRSIASFYILGVSMLRTKLPGRNKLSLSSESTISFAENSNLPPSPRCGLPCTPCRHSLQ